MNCIFMSYLPLFHLISFAFFVKKCLNVKKTICYLSLHPAPNTTQVYNVCMLWGVFDTTLCDIVWLWRKTYAMCTHLVIYIFVVRLVVFLPIQFNSSIYVSVLKSNLESDIVSFSFNTFVKWFSHWSFLIGFCCGVFPHFFIL
jgi:hypothetical protein